MSGGIGGSRKAKKKLVSKTSMADLQFLVGRLAHYLKKGRYAQHIGSVAHVYLDDIIEYLATEVLELFDNVAHDNKKTRIIPHHTQLDIRNDKELGKLLSRVTISCGVLNFVTLRNSLTI